MSAEMLGQLLTAAFSIPGGEARLFERGATITGAGGEAVVACQLPMIGRPSIVTGDLATAPVFEMNAVRFARGGWPLEELAGLVQSTLARRPGLVPTGQAPGALPITSGREASHEGPLAYHRQPRGDGSAVCCRTRSRQAHARGRMP